MALIPTVILAACALALTVLFGWLGARPASPLRGPRLVPWRFLMLLTFLGMVLALVHLVALVRGG
ncbi:MAG TPA: hypothetical protein VH353_16075 [Caulobacteraceae bacterium]|jgi:hypothetical protein|nr:hypothetical protein [Caulobacteraceae bacterium]